MMLKKWISCFLFFTSISHATEIEIAREKCLHKHLLTAAGSMTLAELRTLCEQLVQKGDKPIEEVVQETLVGEDDLRPVAKRMNMEALDRSNRFMLTPHKRNFFYPVSHIRTPNNDPYVETGSSLQHLDNTEAELQLSIKILIRESIFDDNGHLYLGYTNHSFWQAYSDNDSAPFRETDHQPEFILSFTNDWKIFGFQNSVNQFIINHQSNGTGGLLSRSWNRIMWTSIFERNNFVFSLTPWYRIPEPKQEYPGDPDGDDNPDITHYMGNFEFSSAYKKGKGIFSLMLRNNFDADNKGAIEVGYSFPFSTQIRGQLSYFNGYGHSLIDYNSDLEVFKVGIIFTDLF
jgi:phospholipase A1